MNVVLLVAITLALGYVTLDAFSMRGGEYKKLPYNIIAKILGRDISHLSLEEQERLRQYNLRYGIGNVDHAPWIFLLFFLAFAIATVIELLS
jgi:hypothetical protein